MLSVNKENVYEYKENDARQDRARLWHVSIWLRSQAWNKKKKKEEMMVMKKKKIMKTRECLFILYL